MTVIMDIDRILESLKRLKGDAENGHEKMLFTPNERFMSGIIKGIELSIEVIKAIGEKEVK